MILKTKEFKEVCSSILSAIDSDGISKLTETLELVTIGKVLYLNVTNMEYYVSRKFELSEEEELHATVKGDVFLKLIDKITTEDIELTVGENYLLVKGNGVYKLPFIDEDGKLMELPKIVIENKTLEMDIPYDTLESILVYNTKQIAESSLAQAVNKLFYVDQEGCVTFVKGACVNSFTLAKPVRILLGARIVKLFKLFKNTPMVHFELEYDPISETIIQTKVTFSNEDITLTAILNADNSMWATIDKAIPTLRERAVKAYPNKIVLNKDALLEAVHRLLLFADAKDAKPYSTFNFDITGNLTIFDTKGENSEALRYQPGSELEGAYTMRLDLVNFAKIIETCPEQFLTLHFGDNKACVVVRNNIKNVIPEVKGK